MRFLLMSHCCCCLFIYWFPSFVSPNQFYVRLGIAEYIDQWAHVLRRVSVRVFTFYLCCFLISGFCNSGWLTILFAALYNNLKKVRKYVLLTLFGLQFSAHFTVAVFRS